MACTQVSYSIRIASASADVSTKAFGSLLISIRSFRTLNVAIKGACRRSAPRAFDAAWTDLCMALQWPARLFVDIHDLSVWVTRQVDSHLNLNFCHLFINFRLLIHYIPISKAYVVK